MALSSAKRTTWIFGAGASCTSPYNLPAQKQMLSYFMKRARPGNAAAQASLADLRKRIEQLIKVVLPGAAPDTVILEDLFSAYELRASHARSTPEEAREAVEALQSLRQALFISVQEFGPGNLPKWLPYQRSGTPAPYAELLERLYQRRASPEAIRSHTLVTMNYDINLDRCALNMRASAAGAVDLDYGFELANYRMPNDFVRPSDRSILLLRLHGSINWIRCLACQAVFTTINRQANVDERQTCLLCRSESADRILVHPSYLRAYSDPILQIVWGRFQEELTSSERWVFIGYSLPDADVHLRDVLRHALHIRERNGDPTEVVWAGYRSSTDDSWEPDRDRYHSMFGEALSPWNATGGGFADFVKALDS
jgi:hypothetical protein